VSRDYLTGTSTDTKAGYGMDVKVGLTSTYNADLTYKADFAQVEADQEVVNLSRFSLFFPEKRQFFTESAGLFDYGRAAAGSTDAGMLPLYYSRTIGLDAGHEVPILAGGRVTGRSGRTSVGVMNIETDPTAFTSGLQTVDVPRANYSVVRVKRDVLSNSSIGGIFLNREGGRGAAFNRTFGLDGLFTVGKHLDFSVFGARTFSPGTSGRDWAGAGWVNWKNDLWDFSGQYVDIAERFNAEMGFIARTDIRNGRVAGAWTPRPGWRGVRQLRLNMDASYYENHAGRVESRSHFALYGSDSSSVGFSIDHNYDYLPFNWATAGGVIPIGGYSWTTARASYTSNQSRPLYGSLSTTLGGYYDGDRRSVSASLNVVPRDTLLVETSYTRNHIVLPASAPYVTNVLSARVSYSFSAALFVKSYIQYNDASHSASLNLLLWCIYRPGSDLYIVYDQGWDTDLPGPRDHRVRGRSLAVKMTYWLSR
jgi:hypothetical protein